MKKNLIDLPVIPEGMIHNAHMFYLKTRDLEQRTEYIEYMKANDIACVFHYIPLHTSPAGLKYCRFAGEDIYTTRESERLVRLPLYYGLTYEDQDKVIEMTRKFLEK